MDGPASVEVAVASRILAMLGIVDAFGHVSRRDPAGSGGFLMSRSLAPACVQPHDVLTLDADGESIGGDGKLFLERFIHSGIYRARPEIGAVVHAHTAAVIPYSVVPEISVRPICHVCGFLAGTPDPFDLADHGGPETDLLISTRDYGDALASHLGSAAVVLMRGHGFTAVGRDLVEAVFRAIYTVRNCEIQSAALALGVPRFLTAGEAAACDRTTTAQATRAWNLWMRDAAVRFPDLKATMAGTS